MSSSRLVRGAKTRMFACVCLILILGALIYIFHGTQTKLSDVQNMVTACNQQQEALTAQLQVIFEYKSQLEQSLQKEKANHKKTKDSLDAQIKEAKDEKQKLVEANEKYNALLQKHNILQSTHNDLKETSDKEIAQLTDEKTRLGASLQATKDEISRMKLKLNNEEDLKAKYIQLAEENKALKEENKKIKKLNELPSNKQLEHYEKLNSQLERKLEDTQNALDRCEGKAPKDETKKISNNPISNEVAEKPVSWQGSSTTTTPVINPDAVSNHEVSSARPVLSKEPESRNGANNVGPLPDKKSTQESVLPIVGPKEEPQGNLQNNFGPGGPGGLIGQIPGPPKPLAPAAPQPLQGVLGGVIQRPNVGGGVDEDHAGERAEEEPVGLGVRGRPIQEGAEPRDGNNAEEQDEDDDPNDEARHVIAGPPQLQENQEIPRPAKSARGEQHYNGGEYDKEQQEEEEDDDGEQIDYVQNQDVHLREGRGKLMHSKNEQYKRDSVMLMPK